MNVKAQGLLNGAAWVRENHGDAGLERVLVACPPVVRERLKVAIAINWHPFGELAAFLSAAEKVLGRNDGRTALAIGAFSAKASLRGTALRLAFFLGKPEFLLRRVAGVWRQYNDGGDMKVVQFDPGLLVAELVDAPDSSFFVCCSVGGWLQEAGLATGMDHPAAQHVECKDRRGTRCVWHLRWRLDAAAPSTRPPPAIGPTTPGPPRRGHRPQLARPTNRQIPQAMTIRGARGGTPSALNQGGCGGERPTECSAKSTK